MTRPPRPPRILVVAMAESVHTARWISAMQDDRWDVHLFPVTHRPLHVELRDVTVHGLVRRRRAELDPTVHQRGIPWLLPRGWVRFSRALERVPPMNPARRLARVIASLRPDLVHSLEMQHAAYLVLESRARVSSARFPPWIYSCWGSDLFFFGRRPEHEQRVRAVLAACDYLTTDCRRDVALAREFGFRGKALGIFPGPGGFDVRRMRAATPRIPASSRTVIAVKGTQDWAGRGMMALQAVRLSADLLLGHQVVVYSASEEVEAAAAALSAETGLAVSVLPQSPWMTIAEVMGRARVALAVNVSDGTPNAMLEAMIMGAFPVQSDTISTREWLRNGENGFLVPPEEPEAVAAALREALTNDALVDRAMATNERLTSACVGHDVVQPRIVRMYEEAARRAAKPER